VALRYDEETRKVRSLVPAGATTTLIDTCGLGVGNAQPINPGLCNGPITDEKETFDELQPKFALTWDANEDTTLYGSIGVGFKSGGFNSQGSADTVNLFINDALLGTGAPFEGDFEPVDIQDSYKKETSTAWEVGVKRNWMDGRVRTELSYYNTSVDDMQFFEFFVGPFGLLRVVSNIDQVDIRGGEASINFRANDWLNLYAGGNIIASEIKENQPRPDTVGNESPYTPDYTFNAGAEVNFPAFGDINFVGGIDLNTIGETWFHVVQKNERPTIFTLGFPFLGPAEYTVAQRDAYSLVNLRMGFQNDTWSAVLFVKNALDENHLEEIIPAPEFGGSFIHPGSERRIGIEGTFKF
jgi:iron complex outermembrane recepter protein